MTSRGDREGKKPQLLSSRAHTNRAKHRMSNRAHDSAKMALIGSKINFTYKVMKASAVYLNGTHLDFVPSIRLQNDGFEIL